MPTQLKTTDIKGKPYVEVNTRIAYFRKTYPEGRIVTDVLEHTDGLILMRAQVYTGSSFNGADFPAATGHAYEKEGTTYINKTSYIENCETSCIGRALGILGIGIGSSVASAEEVSSAVEQQADEPAPKKDPPKSRKAGAVPEHEKRKLKEWTDEIYDLEGTENILKWREQRAPAIRVIQTESITLKLSEVWHKHLDKWKEVEGPK